MCKHIRRSEESAGCGTTPMLKCAPLWMLALEGSGEGHAYVWQMRLR